MWQYDEEGNPLEQKSFGEFLFSGSLANQYGFAPMMPSRDDYMRDID